jgi:hypothetical protein
MRLHWHRRRPSLDLAVPFAISTTRERCRFPVEASGLPGFCYVRVSVCIARIRIRRGATVMIDARKSEKER